MSIATMINWNRKYSMGIEDLISYLWASSKTRGGRYTGTNNLLTHMPAMEMNALKKLHHKPGGRQWGHLAVSLTPDNEDRDSYAYLSIAKRLAVSLFHDYQCAFCVHADTNIRHLHFAWNSVSCIDGHKYSISKHELHLMKQRINDIIVPAGFDPILMSADRILNKTDYSNATTPTFLEISEIVPTGGLDDYHEMLQLSDLHDGFQHQSIPYDLGGRIMDQGFSFSPLAMLTSSEYPAEMQQNQLPEFSDRSALIAVPSVIKVLESPDTPPEQTAALVHELMHQGSDYAMSAAKIGSAIHRQNLSFGVQEDMIFSPTPAIIIDRRGFGNEPNGSILDVPYTENNGK